MPLPAIALLEPSCRIKPAWAFFDHGWYLKTYRRCLPAGLSDAPQNLLMYYLQSGCRAGHSPNYFFAEQFYLRSYPDIAAQVEAGRYRSGFDHFCRSGHRLASPHWLFDDQRYGDLYPDMTFDNLARNQFYGRYDHYLKTGQHEHRAAHLLFDSRFYRAAAIAAGEDADAIGARGCFTHYLERLQSDAAEPAPSIYFDPAWYMANNDTVRVEIEARGFGSAIEHYLFDGSGDPLPEFSEAFYLDANADVRHAISSGQYRNGYHHFIQLGAFELRRPGPDIDLLAYRDANSQVRNDLNAGMARDAFAHLLEIGKGIGLSAAPFSADSQISETQTKQLFIEKARANLGLFARRKLDFTPRGLPRIAVVMVLFEKFELTMLALCALRQNYPDAIELIVIDNASADDSRRIGEYVDGAKITLLTSNIGYPRACNLGLAQVTAELVLFLNNDVELGFGALGAAIGRMQSDANIGAAGGKIVRTHGRLQEAGSIIWRDGAVTGYMRDASPLAPEANFVRDVDFCSGVFLLCRAEVIARLGGFDPDFSPAYYEDVDLCRRVAAAGYRVVYDPGIVIHHLEYGSAATTEASMTLMRRGQKIFIRKHEDFLKRKLEYKPRHIVHARSAPRSARRILFIEDTVPLRHLGSGYVRSNDVVRAIAADHDVSVFPLNGARYDIMRMLGDFPDDVEILHDRDINRLGELLESREDYYDAIWISRTHNLRRILPVLRTAGIDPERTPLILDTEAIATVRQAARAALDPALKYFDTDNALRDEFAQVDSCSRLIVVNRREADLLGRIGLSKVSVLGTMRDPRPTGNSFSAREGLLFVAAIHQPDSPNLDALHWYADAILPALAMEMREVPLLDVVGHIGSDIDLGSLPGHAHIKFHGPMTDLGSFYNRNRVFIAPTRFAAGTPYKIYETASFGLPTVATDLLAAQLGWCDGIELLASPVDDATRFAARIAHLYRSEQCWNELRANALRRIETENKPDSFNAAVADILRTV